MYLILEVAAMGDSPEHYFKTQKAISKIIGVIPTKCMVDLAIVSLLMYKTWLLNFFFFSIANYLPLAEAV